MMYVYFKLVCVGQFFGFFQARGKASKNKKKTRIFMEGFELMYVCAIVQSRCVDTILLHR